MPSLRDSNVRRDLSPRVCTRGFNVSLLRSSKNLRDSKNLRASKNLRDSKNLPDSKNLRDSKNLPDSKNKVRVKNNVRPTAHRSYSNIDSIRAFR